MRDSLSYRKKLRAGNRALLITTIAVDLAKRGTKEDRLSLAVEEWLDGHKWAGNMFDNAGWDFKRLVQDITKVYRRHVQGT